MTDVTTATENIAGPAAPRPARKEPEFLRYLGGESVSQLGNQIWYVALSWTAVHLGSPGSAGVLLTVSALPRIVLMLFGGVIADRYDIRRLMLGSDVLRTVVTLVAAGLALAYPGIALLAVLAVVFGIVDAVFMPAAGAMQPRLLAPEQYAGGAVLANMAARLALSLGAPLGGLLVALGGLPLALVVDAATFAVSVATLATVRPRPLPTAAADAAPEAGAAPRVRRSVYQDFRAGLYFLARHPVLGPLTLVVLLTNLGFVGPMNIGMAELSAHRGWGAGGIGLMLTGFGLGSAAAALLMGRLKPRGSAGVWITVCALVEGAAVFSTALAPTLSLAVAATLVVGLSSGPIAVLASVLTQTHTPDEFRGRVTAFSTLINLGLVPLAAAATGFAISALGVTGAYAVCGLIEAAGLLMLLAPGFRKARC